MKWDMKGYNVILGPYRSTLVCLYSGLVYNLTLLYITIESWLNEALEDGGSGLASRTHEVMKMPCGLTWGQYYSPPSPRPTVCFPPEHLSL